VLDKGITINIDSFSQLRRLANMNFKGQVSIRWNPGKGAGTHSHLITAGKWVKFGIPEPKILDAFREADRLGLNVIGLHQHIGSGWLGADVDVFLKTVENTIEVAEAAEKIIGKELQFVDFGGGPGIPYRKGEKEFPIEKYAKGICTKMRRSSLNAKIAVEPGRYLVGDAGVLLLSINTVEDKDVALIGVDGGFSTLIRPAFYGAYHEIVLCNCVNSSRKKKFMVAGNLCESGDVLTESKKSLRELPIPQEGDVLAILNAGAYGYSMASVYNLRGRPSEVMVYQGSEYPITERDSLSDLIRCQKVFR
jgi:diaminopimelate decarboxylase